MTASIVESIRFIREPGSCEFSSYAHHDKWIIQWSDDNGIHSNHVFWCDHPLCDDSPFRLMSCPPMPKLTTWITGHGCQIVAYYLLEFPVWSSSWYTPRMVARIGIGDQWEDPIFGNTALVNGERPLFTQRYFAIEGPGVYPATIETREPCLQQP